MATLSHAIRLNTAQRAALVALMWALFDLAAHQRVRVTVFGLPISLTVAKAEPVLVLLLGPRPAVGRAPASERVALAEHSLLVSTSPFAPRSVL